MSLESSWVRRIIPCADVLIGKPSAIIATYQLPGSNAVDAAAGVNKLMAKMKERFPEDMDYVVALDTTRAVTEGMKESS